MSQDIPNPTSYWILRRHPTDKQNRYVLIFMPGKKQKSKNYIFGMGAALSSLLWSSFSFALLFKSAASDKESSLNRCELTVSDILQ